MQDIKCVNCQDDKKSYDYYKYPTGKIRQPCKSCMIENNKRYNKKQPRTTLINRRILKSNYPEGCYNPYKFNSAESLFIG